MGDKTKIEWTNATWNPIRGCSVVSPGCHNCYAKDVAGRFSGPGLAFEGLAYQRKVRLQIAGAGAVDRTVGEWTGVAKLFPEKLADPLKWKRPRRVFVNSVSDLFHETLTNEEIAAVFGVMAGAPRHTFQVLTKRPQRARDWFSWVSAAAKRLDQSTAAFCAEEACNADFAAPDSKRALALHPGDGASWPLPNVWLGFSAESQGLFLQRWEMMRDVPAALLFVSAEPLLGAVDFTSALFAPRSVCGGCVDGGRDCPGHPYGPRLGWVIAGGESGKRARPMATDWARGLREQCRAAGVPFFFKQFGEWKDGERVGKTVAGASLDGFEHKAFP